MEGVVEGLKGEKRPSTLKLKRLEVLLKLYLNPLDQGYLLDGFKFGFRIPFEDP